MALSTHKAIDGMDATVEHSGMNWPRVLGVDIAAIHQPPIKNASFRWHFISIKESALQNSFSELKVILSTLYLLDSKGI
ncbi:hypothetical protein EXU30_11560 [Shewanella maritima]|uniref:Uncharacterized protein n=1 Tax=Shewanella maritima TaxID=2520507 RepID=A0A411PI94_9GAMM|nr:hypothetical protein [Shewanella maritima]QBF83263.1 hypothetical protein EXU30_11560 [Shewanella maritima]